MIVWLDSFDYVHETMNGAVYQGWKNEYPKLRSVEANYQIPKGFMSPHGGRDGRGAWHVDATTLNDKFVFNDQTGSAAGEALAVFVLPEYDVNKAPWAFKESRTSYTAFSPFGTGTAMCSVGFALKFVLPDDIDDIVVDDSEGESPLVSWVAARDNPDNIIANKICIKGDRSIVVYDSYGNSHTDASCYVDKNAYNHVEYHVSRHDNGGTVVATSTVVITPEDGAVRTFVVSENLSAGTVAFDVRPIVYAPSVIKGVQNQTTGITEQLLHCSEMYFDDLYFALGEELFGDTYVKSLSVSKFGSINPEFPQSDNDKFEIETTDAGAEDQFPGVNAYWYWDRLYSKESLQSRCGALSSPVVRGMMVTAIGGDYRVNAGGFFGGVHGSWRVLAKSNGVSYLEDLTAGLQNPGEYGSILGCYRPGKIIEDDISAVNWGNYGDSISYLWSVDPSTDLPWTVSGIDSCQIGFCEQTYSGGEGIHAIWNMFAEVAVSASHQCVANDDPVSMDKDSVAYIQVLDNDIYPTANGQLATITAVTSPSHGTASVDLGADRVVYTPTTGYVGTDTFTYTITDYDGHTDTATVTVTVLETDTGGDTGGGGTGTVPPPEDPDYGLDDIIQEGSVKKRHIITRYRVAYGDDNASDFAAVQRPYKDTSLLPHCVGSFDNVPHVTGYSISATDNMSADQVTMDVVSQGDGRYLQFFHYNDLVTIDEEWIGLKGSTGIIRKATFFVDTSPDDVSHGSRGGQISGRGTTKMLTLTPFHGDMRADKMHVVGPTTGSGSLAVGSVKLVCVNFDSKTDDYYKFVHCTGTGTAEFDPTYALTHHTAMWCDRPAPRLYLGDVGSRNSINIRDGVVQIVYSDGEVIINAEYYNTEIGKGGLGGKYIDDVPVISAEYYRWALPNVDETDIVVYSVGDPSTAGSSPDTSADVTVYGKFYGTGSLLTCSAVGLSLTIDNGGPGAVTRRWKIKSAVSGGTVSELNEDGVSITRDLTLLQLFPDKHNELPTSENVGLKKGDSGIVCDSNRLKRRVREVMIDGGFQDTSNQMSDCPDGFNRKLMKGLFYIKRFDDPIYSVRRRDYNVAGYVDASYSFHLHHYWLDVLNHCSIDAYVNVSRVSGTGNLTVAVTATASYMTPEVPDGRVGIGGTLAGGSSSTDIPTGGDNISAALDHIDQASFTHTSTVAPGEYSLCVAIMHATLNSKQVAPPPVHLDLREDTLSTKMTQVTEQTDSVAVLASSDEFNVREEDGITHQEILEKMRKYFPPNYQYWTDADGNLSIGIVKTQPKGSAGAYVMTEKEKVSPANSDAEIKTKVVYRVRDPELRNVATINNGATMTWNPIFLVNTGGSHTVDGIPFSSFKSSPSDDALKTRNMLDGKFDTVVHCDAAPKLFMLNETEKSARRHGLDGIELFTLEFANVITLGQINIRGTNDMNGSGDTDWNCRIRIEYTKDEPGPLAYWDELISDFEFTKKANNIAAFTSKDFGENIQAKAIRLYLTQWCKFYTGDHDIIQFEFAGISVWPSNIIYGEAILGETEGFTSDGEIDLAKRVNSGLPRVHTVPYIDEQGYQIAQLLYPNEIDTVDEDGAFVSGHTVAIQKYAEERAREWLVEISKDFTPVTIEGVRPELQTRDTIYITQPQLKIYDVPFFVREVQSSHTGKVTAKAVAFSDVGWRDVKSATDPYVAPVNGPIVPTFSVQPVNLNVGTVGTLYGGSPITGSGTSSVTVVTTGISSGSYREATLALDPACNANGATLSGTGISSKNVNDVTPAVYSDLAIDKTGRYRLMVTFDTEGEAVDVEYSDYFLHYSDTECDVLSLSAQPTDVAVSGSTADISDMVASILSPSTSLVDSTFSGTITVSIKSGTGGSNALLKLGSGTAASSVVYTPSSGTSTLSSSASRLRIVASSGVLATAEYVLTITAAGTWSGQATSVAFSIDTDPFTVSGVSVASSRHSVFVPVSVDVVGAMLPAPRFGSPSSVDLSPYLDGKRSVFCLPDGYVPVGSFASLFYNGVSVPSSGFSVGTTSGVTLVGPVRPTISSVVAATARSGMSLTGTHTYMVTATVLSSFSFAGSTYSETDPSFPVAGTVGGGGGLLVTWGAVAGASGYRVYRDGLYVAEVGGSETTFTDDSGYSQGTTMPPSRNMALWGTGSPTTGAGDHGESLVASVALKPSVYSSSFKKQVACIYYPKYKTGENMSDHTPTLPTTPTPDYSSSTWHTAQLADMVSAGFDICAVQLPLVPFDYTSAPNYGSMASVYTPTSFVINTDTSLNAFYTSLAARSDIKAMLILDTASCAGADVDVAAHRAWIFACVYKFYDKFYVSDLFNACVATTTGKQPVAADTATKVLVGFRRPTFVGDLDNFIALLKTGFAARYGGVTLEVVLSGWSDDDANTVGGTEIGVYRGVPFHSVGSASVLRCCTIGPGFDDSQTSSSTAPVRSRESGVVFGHAWESACQTNADIVFVDSWNEMLNGTSICRSVEYGDYFIRTNARYSADYLDRASVAVTSRPASGLVARTNSWNSTPEVSGTAYGRPGYQEDEDSIRVLPVHHYAGSGTTYAAPNSTTGLDAGEIALRPTYPNGIIRTPLWNEVGALEGGFSGYVAFDIADSALYQEPSGSRSITVVYWDDPVGAASKSYMWMEYDAYGDPSRSNIYRDSGSMVTVASSGSAQWRYAVFNLAETYFGNRQSGGGDFRLKFWPYPVWIMLVKVDLS